MLQDAELTAVTFVDADRGWAVGDRGVIWHTSDGGRNWKLQSSGVTCRLEAVQFLDADIGFVVGGWTQPYTHETHGVVLRTRDGGKTWQNTPGLLLPGLKQVRFFDTRQGWCLGDGSALFPSGVFRSEDGGRSWAPVPKGESAGWIAGDFRDSKSGAVAGLSGALGLVTTSEVKPSRNRQLGPRYLRRMQLVGETGGWLIGDGGLVLTTEDSGFSWTAPKGALPAAAGSEFDFRALAARGSRVWIAGAPGTCVLHSPDGGQSWQMFRTEQTLPLSGLCFIDEYRGWAVGALGTILHTRDGGQSWRAQHSGGTRRVALLGVFGEAQRMPLEVLASQAGSEGYLAAVEVVGRRDRDGQRLAGAGSSLDRMQAAVVAVGASASDAAWRFPLAERELGLSGEAIVARWNSANDGQAIEKLQEHLVRRIRQWRPDVIITEDVSPRGDNPLGHLTNQATFAAVAKAATTTEFADQLTSAGLAPWAVKKVFTVLPVEKQGLVNLAPAHWSQRLGRSLAEQAEIGRGMLFHDVTSAPRNVGLALLEDHLPQGSGKRDVMSGIALSPGSEARRLLSNPPGGDLEALSRVAQRRHNVEQLLDRIGADGMMGSGWIGQVADLTKDLSSRQTCEILWQLGRKYQLVGKSEQAAEAFQLLVDKHPQHPLADAAALWLIQYYASSEVAWRQRKETRFDVRLATATNADQEAGGGQASPEQGRNKASGAQQASFSAVGVTRTAAPQLSPSERAGRVMVLAKKIEQARPTLFAEPALRFPLAAAARQAGQARTADRFYQNLASGPSQSMWAQNAVAEQWLTHPNENPPKKICSVVTAAQKPRLDGKLDDPAWSVAKAVSLRRKEGDDAEYPAAAVLAFDDEFLYVAFSCRRAPGVDYEAAKGVRTSDSDLSTHDHVRIHLDIDRDYSSYWTLAVDHRGWPAESCFGDASWNPQWFIAVGGSDEFWTVEAAIPLSELAPKKPQVRDVWAVGLERVIPRAGLQSFTAPAGMEPRPEGFGLLVFE
jgi:photosystem II stability/assembly factor-like uncharacterized protein